MNCLLYNVTTIINNNNSPKSKYIKNPKLKFCLYSKMPAFCQKLGNMDKMEMSSIVLKQIFRPPKSWDFPYILRNFAKCVVTLTVYISASRQAFSIL